MRRKAKPKLEIHCVRTDVTRDHAAIYQHTTVNVKTGEVTSQWHPIVDLLEGNVFCDCEDFRYRRRPQARAEKERPNIGTPRWQCKHLQRAVNDCLDRKDIIFQPNQKELKNYERPAPEPAGRFREPARPQVPRYPADHRRREHTAAR